MFKNKLPITHLNDKFIYYMPYISTVITFEEPVIPGPR